MNLSELKQKPIGELLDIAKELGLENLARNPQTGRYLLHPQESRQKRLGYLR